MKLRPARPPLAVWLLALLGLAVFLPGVWWGAPDATHPDRVYSWGVDDETPLGPLAEVHNILEPKPDRNLGYPLMYSFVVAAAYAPYLAYLKATGGWGKISGEFPFGFSDPVGTLKVMTVIAHGVTALMAVGIVLAAFGIGSVLVNRRAGVLTALFAMSSYPMFYYGRSGNVDVPMLFFGALTLWMFANGLARGFTVRRAIWMGVFGGFALGTKEQVVGLFLVIPIAMVLECAREHGGNWRSFGFWRAPLAAVVASVLSFGIGSGLFVEPSRYIAHVRLLSERMQVIARGEIYVPYVYPFGWDGHVGYLARTLELLGSMISIPGAILALAGVVWMCIRRPLAGWGAAAAVSYFVFVFLTMRSPQMRYLMPGTFLLALPAAWLVAIAWDARSRAVRVGATAIAVGVIVFNLLRGGGLVYEMIEDSRYEAAAWLAERTQRGETVEYFGPTNRLPALAAGVEMRRAAEWKGIYRMPSDDDATVKEILGGIEERQPPFIVIMPDMSSAEGRPYSSACPPRVFARLQDGSLGYVQAAEFHTAPLFAWLDLPPLDYPSVNPPIRIFTPRGVVR